MAENDQIDFPQKQEAWANFVRLSQWITGLSALTLILLALFLL